MSRKKKTEVVNKLPAPDHSIDAQLMLTEYQMMLETDKKYSLEVDPENKYEMSDTQKEFISAYVQFKSIPLAASLAHLEPEQATEVFNMYSTQQEIRRINRAMYARQFSTKMLSIDQLGGYLSALLMDENVPYADRLKSSDKLRVVQMLISLNDYKANSFVNPSQVMTKDFETEVKSLGLETIRQLVNADNSLQAKRALIKELNADGTLTVEDISFLETLSYDELLKIIDKINTSKEY